MKNVIDFLSELRFHNDKDWFDANKDRHKMALAEFNAFTEQLIDGIAAFDPSVQGLGVKDCTYRIYRDLRFSPDKTPYKTYMGAYVCRGGKKSSYAGYYFHVEPEVSGGKGGNFLTSGLYCPEPKVLKSVREEILDHGAALVDAISMADGFTVFKGNMLKRTPKDFPANSPYDYYFRLKDVYLEKRITNESLLEDDLLEKVLAGFKSTKPFLDILNRAAQYAFDEM